MIRGVCAWTSEVGLSSRAAEQIMKISIFRGTGSDYRWKYSTINVSVPAEILCDSYRTSRLGGALPRLHVLQLRRAYRPETRFYLFSMC